MSRSVPTIAASQPAPDTEAMHNPVQAVPMKLRILEWAGSILGLAGSAALATNTPFSKYGWIAFLMANFAIIGFARGIRAHGLLLQQLGFCLTSVVGLFRAF